MFPLQNCFQNALKFQRQKNEKLGESELHWKLSFFLNKVHYSASKFLETTWWSSSYAKLLLNGVYEFLEKLRTLLTATEQAAQTFAEKQAEEEFHPQLEALLVTWMELIDIFAMFKMV